MGEWESGRVAAPVECGMGHAAMSIVAKTSQRGRILGYRLLLEGVSRGQLGECSGGEKGRQSSVSDTQKKPWENLDEEKTPPNRQPPPANDGILRESAFWAPVFAMGP